MGNSGAVIGDADSEGNMLFAGGGRVDVLEGVKKVKVGDRSILTDESGATSITHQM